MNAELHGVTEDEAAEAILDLQRIAEGWKRLAATYESEARERASRQAVLEQANRALIARIRRLETERDDALAQVPQRRPAVGEIPTGYDPIEEARRWLGEQGLSR